jgi:hypothetical protein
VAVLVVVLGSSHATSASCHRGWWLLVASGLLSALSVAFSRTSRRTTELSGFAEARNVRRDEPLPGH